MNILSSNHRAQRGSAIASVVAAIALAFFSVYISEDHDVASGVAMQCAQFLTFAGTVFGIDYKFTHSYDSTGNKK